jgi:hypothetical protein
MYNSITHTNNSINYWSVPNSHLYNILMSVILYYFKIFYISYYVWYSETIITLVSLWMYRVFILQAYQMSGELLRISYRETVWQSPANWRSFIRWSLDQCSLAPTSVTEASYYCALFYVFMARVRYNLQQRVFIYDCYVKTNHAGENFAVNFLTHVHLEIQFPN